MLNKRFVLSLTAMIMAAAVGILALSCKKTVQMTSPLTSEAPVMNPGDALVDIKTSKGDIRVHLFGDTPKHRDNFLKLAKEGFYNDLLFHRVIDQFMIQGGDPDSKNAPADKQLGSGDPGYTIEAEIVCPTHFHYYGALAAAREPDQVNPEMRSSGSQFYIVTGKVFNAEQLTQLEKGMLQLKKQHIFQQLSEEHSDTILALRKSRNMSALMNYRQELMAQTEKLANADTIKFTDQQRRAYSTIGGTPHLDGTYTVFGEVVSGMDVVEKIQKVKTNKQDRPEKDVKIISMTVVEE
jgi:peptidylprolyl isomerase/peptidyl-prolyl cis-trans isomerase B (cyclophilin B)